MLIEGAQHLSVERVYTLICHSDESSPRRFTNEEPRTARFIGWGNFIHTVASPCDLSRSKRLLRSEVWQAGRRSARRQRSCLTRARYALLCLRATKTGRRSNKKRRSRLS